MCPLGQHTSPFSLSSADSRPGWEPLKIPTSILHTTPEVAMSDNQPPEGFDPQQVSLKSSQVQDQAEYQDAVDVPEIGAELEGGAQ